MAHYTPSLRRYTINVHIQNIAFVSEPFSSLSLFIECTSGRFYADLLIVFTIVVVLLRIVITVLATLFFFVHLQDPNNFDRCVHNLLLFHFAHSIFFSFCNFL